MTAPNLLAIVDALAVAHPELITLIFDSAVTSTHYGTGLSLTINGQPLSFVSAAGGGSANEIVVTLAGGPAYTAVLAASYDATAGDWNNGGSPVATFAAVPVVNGSTVGRPSSHYPLSSIITKAVVASAGQFTGTITADLNMIDSTLAQEYAPAFVDFGIGPFGVTEANPAGIGLPSNPIQLVNGLSVSQPFTSVYPAWAAAAALDWEVQCAQKIGNTLAALRTADAGTNLGADVIAQF